MNKYLYAILRLKTTSWIKYWLYNKTMKIKGVLSNILEGISFYLTDSLNREFNLFQIIGRSVQDGTPTPENPIEIKNTGDSGSINEKVTNADETQEQNISFPLAEGQKFMEDDYLADDGVHHVRKQVQLTGNENWYIDNSCFITTTYSDIKISDTLNKIIVTSSHFLGANTNWRDNIAIGCIAKVRNVSDTNKNKQIGVKVLDTFSTVADFKTFLQNNNVIIEYLLEQEVIDPYTPEQQIVWEQIKALRTYKNVTIISSEDELPANLKIQYWKEG